MSMAPETLPIEVQEFLVKVQSLRRVELRINPLLPEAAVRYTAALRSQSLRAEHGFIVLDDAEDSNPFCYLSAGVARGMIARLCHDGELKIVFSDLDSFYDALTKAVAMGMDLDELQHERCPVHPNQSALREELRICCERAGDEVEFSICLLLPLLAATDTDTLNAISMNGSLFVREAVAEFIQTKPLQKHATLARHLSFDSSPQVQAAAKRALHALLEQARS